MPGSASINTVEQSDEYYHVRYSDPDDFDDIRTPDWAANAAGSVVDGAEVRTGDTKGNDDWEIESVLVPTDAVSDESEARGKAEQIVEKIRS